MRLVAHKHCQKMEYWDGLPAWSASFSKLQQTWPGQHSSSFKLTSELTSFKVCNMWMFTELICDTATLCTTSSILNVWNMHSAHAIQKDLNKEKPAKTKQQSPVANTTPFDCMCPSSSRPLSMPKLWSLSNTKTDTNLWQSKPCDLYTSAQPHAKVPM